MVDLMRDMGGIVEQINPAKLTQTVKVQPASTGNARNKPKSRKKK
jgi:hypothetical protein